MSKAGAKGVLRELRKFWMKCGAQGRVIIAVSGGVDSMVLLEGLHRLAKGAERQRLLVAHVNHGLRAEESDADERLVLARAAELGLQARAFRLHLESLGQDSYRRARDEALRSLCLSPVDRIWFAHHLNDQAETIFFRLLRGTGAKGLRGILPENGVKIRPLLALEKEQLVRAATEWGVVWREDRSNADAQAYERNWIRGFFPELEKRRPRFQRKLAALAEEARAWRFERELPLDLQAAGAGIVFARLRAAPSTRILAVSFSLSRLHAQGLARLLEKPGGKFEAERARFSWSAGVLLCERETRFQGGLLGRSGSPQSALGRWVIPARLNTAEQLRGESCKKEFQALRVPGFFRSAIPLVVHGGRPSALLPARLEGRLSGVAGLRFEPSPLATWWLEKAPSTVTVNASPRA